MRCRSAVGVTYERMMDVGGCQSTCRLRDSDCELWARLWGGACFDTRHQSRRAEAGKNIMRSVTLLFLGALAMTTCQEAEVRATRAPRSAPAEEIIHG